jgi:hypothetical protein
VVVGQTTLKPGESTTLSMEFTMGEGMGGPHLFRVDVRTNDPAASELALFVRSSWSR